MLLLMSGQHSFFPPDESQLVDSHFRNTSHMQGNQFSKINLYLETERRSNDKVGDFATAFRERKLFGTAKGLKLCKHKAFVY